MRRTIALTTIAALSAMFVGIPPSSAAVPNAIATAELQSEPSNPPDSGGGGGGGDGR